MSRSFGQSFFFSLLWMKIAFSVTLGLFGCAHQPGGGTGPEAAPQAGQYDWKEFLATQEKLEISLDAMLGKLSVEFEGKDESVRGLGTSAILRPDHYLLEIRDPLGRLHFQAVSRGVEFEGYFPRLNRLYQDKLSGKRFFQKTWALPISFPELSRLSAGLLPKPLQASKPGDATWKAPNWEVPLKLDGSEVTVKLRADGRLSRLEWRRAEGDIQVEWRDYRPCCKSLASGQAGAPLDFAHVIEVKTADTVISIHWKSIQKWAAPSLGSFKVQLSAATKVIALD